MNCDVSTTATIANTYEKYVKERSKQVSDETSFSRDAKVKFKGVSASSDFNASFKHEQEESSIHKAFSEQKKEVSTTKAICYTSDMSFSSITRPKFTPMFVNGLTMLNNAVEKDESDQRTAYIHFTKEFGTHYVKKSEFGAGFSMHHIFNSRSTSQYQENNRRECQERSANFCMSGGIEGAKNSASLKQCAANKHKSCMASKDTGESGYSTSEEQTIITTRGVRTGDLNGLITNDLSPVPVKVHVAAIQDLMKQDWLNENKDYNMPKTLNAQKIKDLLTKGLEKWYCVDVLGLTEDNCYEPKIERRCGLNDDCPTGTVCTPNKSATKGYDCVKQSKDCCYSPGSCFSM